MFVLNYFLDKWVSAFIENDLGIYTWERAGCISFAENVKHHHGYEYWQCVPKENIVIHLSAAMNDRYIDAPANAVQVEMMGRIKLEVNKGDAIHAYELRKDRNVFRACYQL